MSQSIEHFKIVRKLGNQTKRKFGEVFLLASPDGQKAVLKLVRKDGSTEKIAHRLRREATFSFDHEQLPNVMSFVENDSEVALVLQYREGIPLSEWGTKLTAKERRKRLPEILDAIFVVLKTIHEKGILHLDLKPDNLLVSETSLGLKVSVIDFGMAINLAFPEKRDTLFSLPFSSPELILNRSDQLGVSSDFFSVGMVVYHFLEQKLPFQSSNPSVYTNLQLVHPIPDVKGISKKQNELLKSLTAKPFFRTAPNLLKEPEVTTALKNAIDQRISVMNDFVDTWKASEKKSLFKRLKR